MFPYFKINPDIISLLFSIFLLRFTICSSSPLSLCTVGTFSYVPDSSINSKTCGLSPDLADTYQASVNNEFFNSNDKCGICYEMVGPFGVVKIRIEDNTTDTNSDVSIPHFKLGTKASFILLGLNDTNYLDQDRKISVSLRMISCGYSDKIKILTGEEDYKGYSFSCLILNSNISVSDVRLKENQESSYIVLKRNNENYFIYEKGDLISYPINLRMVAITGEIVNVTISSKESEETYELSGNFLNPENYLFTIDTLKKVKDVEPEKCCSVDYSSFTPIYSNGELNQIYSLEYYNSTIDSSSSDTFDINFSNYGKLIIKSSVPIRADQFILLTLSLKANKICKECLYISAFDKNEDGKLQIQKADTFKNYQYLFQDLGVEGNTFYGIVIYTKDSSIEVSINNIELVENSDAPSTEICLGETSDWIPYVPSEKDINKISSTVNNIIISTVVTNIETIGINVKNISLINSTFILVQCENFKIINNEAINLNFSSSSNYFETKNCILDYNLNYTQSFNCEITNISNIPNDEYSAETFPENKYYINNTEKIRIENGIIYYNYIPVTPTQLKTESIEIINITDVPTTIPAQNNNKIVITNSINTEIKKGDKINFQINPIKRSEYNRITQIIFMDNNSQNKNALYLKNCISFYSGTEVTSINCSVSNNTIRGTYTTLASGQNIEISQGQSINLISTNSSGGFFAQDMNQIINANISRRYKRNYTLSFNITYYGQNLKPKDLFPYAVYIFRSENNTRSRNLDSEINYTSSIQFPNCSMGNYSNNSQNSGEIEGITCHLPDFIPAGNYTKLTSDGFDINPNNKINIYFPYDFNKSQNYLSNNSGTRVYGVNNDESSSSKTWVIWLVLGILVVALAVVLIIAFCINKRRNSKNISMDSNGNNDSQTNQINNSNNISIDNSANKNNNNNNNSISQSQTS